MNPAFSEPVLIKYVSAIEDLQKSTNTRWQRYLPEWRGYLERKFNLTFSDMYLVSRYMELKL
ncbi:hypothetical protein N7468_010467 [Penicillium chermesinum]|uniref:Uncharacterized protein n=1 Tax=Penicillium chermesinum TaxID=63820 RepID=A0A9W9T9S1_9EURO|nr:uncharacterized protein N7468_010467 [Penicillium chermesinum]KAJ5214788.1 hypothetical protein N7468_010467 [Penicillium chermesinum]